MHESRRHRWIIDSVAHCDIEINGKQRYFPTVFQIVEDVGDSLAVRGVPQDQVGTEEVHDWPVRGNEVNIQSKWQKSIFYVSGIVRFPHLIR